MSVFYFAALCVNSEPHQTRHSVVAGYRIAANEAEARGYGLQSALEEKPDFNVAYVLVGEIPADAFEPAPTDPMKELCEALEKICAEADKIRQLPPSDSFRDGLVEGLSWARTIARTALENAKGGGR